MSMFNVCPQCGEYCVEKIIEPSEPGSANTAHAICPFCHYAHQFFRQPLFIITGASGAGKSTACLALVPILEGAVNLWCCAELLCLSNLKPAQNAVTSLRCTTSQWFAMMVYW